MAIVEANLEIDLSESPRSDPPRGYFFLGRITVILAVALVIQSVASSAVPVPPGDAATGTSQSLEAMPNTLSKVQTEAEASTPKPPNILLILADDLGYSDIGAFGSEISTPNLDQLAKDGLRLTNFHVAPACAPTRAMLMTGTYHHRVGLGKMVEYMQLAAPEYLGLPGYEGYLNFDGRTLPQRLQEAGYRTYISGKWHLGLDTEHSPRALGFDRSYAMLEGAANHFNDRQLVPGTHSDRVSFREDGELTKPGEGFYSSEAYTDKLIEYLESDGRGEKPFFAYLSFTAPHWPLQAPEASIARYEGVYDDGYDVLYERRLASQKRLGLVDPDFTGHAKPPRYRDWVSLTPEEKRYSARLMEIYAAMISDMDAQIGRVIDTLRQRDDLGNTLILFFSDNGATGGNHVHLKAFRELIAACCENSYENMGRHDSYLVLGDEWARVSSGANRHFKGYTAEGGIRSPAIVHYPPLVGSGSRYDGFLTVMDVYPTLLAIAGMDTRSIASTESDRLLEGRSFEKILLGDSSFVHGLSAPYGWEWNNNRALWRGNLKLVITQPPLGNGAWELYDMHHDPHETQNLAGEEPELLQSMIDDWHRYAERSGVILDPAAYRDP